MKLQLMQQQHECSLYELGPCYRGSEISRWHRISFSMLEWYRPALAPECAYSALIQEAILLVQNLVQRELPVTIKKVSDVVPYCLDQQMLTKQAQRLGWAHNSTTNTADTLLDYIIQTEIILPERHKQEILVLFDYPSYASELSALHTDSDYAQRFELWCCGTELVNGCTELNCVERYQRLWQTDNAVRQQNNQPTIALDQQYLNQLRDTGLHAVGAALGFDRVTMLARALASSSQGLPHLH